MIKGLSLVRFLNVSCNSIYSTPRFCDISARCFSNLLSKKSIPKCVTIHPQVREAIEEQAPIVALESAIITHGMSYPFNLQTALDIEAVIKEKGAFPATIGIIDGQIYVGLTTDQIEFLATCKSKCFKVSRRDFPYVLSKKFHGGTTVAGTMVIANIVDIPIFVTGGIGGVHKGGHNTLDVSADLTELGRTPVTVISAGVKSILDVGRTLEYLETQGVCVATLRYSPSFPDFFTRDSGFESPCHMESCSEVAEVIHQRNVLKLDSGILIAVPIPKHQEADGIIIKKAIEQALVEAETSVRGRDVTPFVLKRVAEITEGKSILTNINLIKNNAKHGAEIAVHYSKLVNKDKKEQYPIRREEDNHGPQPVVIGGSIVDMTVKILEDDFKLNGGTHNGKLTQSFGGVGRNVADALTRLGLKPLFISAVGGDAASLALLSYNPNLNLKGILREKKSQTASYSVLLDKRGEAMIGVGDMEIHSRISPQLVRKFEKEIEQSPIVVLDGNVSLETMETVFEICEKKKIPTWYEPTDVTKSIKPWNLLTGKLPSFISPNLNEFNAIIRHVSKGKCNDVTVPNNNCDNTETYLELILSESKRWLTNLDAVMITLGENGFMILRWCSRENENSPLLSNISKKPIEEYTLVGLHFNVPRQPSISSVSGAGDCLAAGFLAGMIQGKCVSECAFIGASCAAYSLEDSAAVPESIAQVSTSSHRTLPYKLYC